MDFADNSLISCYPNSGASRQSMEPCRFVERIPVEHFPVCLYLTESLMITHSLIVAVLHETQSNEVQTALKLFQTPYSAYKRQFIGLARNVHSEE